ncbi:MAG TPA: SPW repeat protein [Yinghuangia sp.]|uniref:SPW repeat domain-containing protein n=1 Tax=Yinghuangia sp. YIM S10712 TaxID=3436930 RepID=UPI002D092F68|nr:SPW repeat protein [Yinghuangia sp.]
MGAHIQQAPGPRQIPARRPSNRHVHAEHAGDVRDAVLNTLLFAVGLWLIASSWVLNYPLDDAADDARFQEVLTGLIVLAVAARGTVRPRGMVSDLLLLASGAWLVAAPFAMGYADNPAVDEARTNDMGTGIVLLAIAVTSIILDRVRRRALRR